MHAFPSFRPTSRTGSGLRRAALAVALAAVVAPAAAQTLPEAPDADRSAATLDKVVVTASAREQRIKDAPASISILTREELVKAPVVDVADAISRLEGVSIVGNNPNETDISIRGLSGEYTLLLVDGKRQNSRETMNRGTGGVQSNLLPPLAAIERIEVVRGPMSSLYGSDAIGGVINVITRKVTDRWIGSANVGVTLQSDSAMGNGTQGGFWLGGPLSAGRVGLQAWGKYQDRGEDDIFHAAPFTSGAFGFDSRGGGARLSFMPGDAHTFSVEASTDNMSYVRTPGRSVGANAVKHESEHRRDTWALTHEGQWGFGSSTVALQREEVEKIERYQGIADPNRPVVRNTVLDAMLVMPLGNNVLKTGGQYRQDGVRGIAGQDSIPGYQPNVDEVEFTSWALFAENDFLLTDAFTLTAGVRLDHDERFGSHWTPRLYGVWHINDTLTLRGGVAEGFRAPTVRQSVPGYCMTSGGAHLPPGSLCGNPDLNPETSLNSELGLGWTLANSGTINVTLFNNRFKNKVASYDTGVPDPQVPGRYLYVYENIDAVDLRGVEVGAALPLAERWNLAANYTFTDSKRKGDRGEPAFDGTSLDGKPLDKTPRHMFNARLDWQVNDTLDLYLRGNMVGKQYWAGFRNGATATRERPGSSTYDLGGNWEVTPNLRIGLAVLNLTDKIVAVDTRGRFEGLDGNWMVDEGRRLWVSLDVGF